jgi:hypothetical protein
MHVHHCCLAMMGVCRSLAASRPPPPPSRFSILAALILVAGRIPRGRAKAPESAVPRSVLGAAELSSLVDECERTVGAAKRLDRGAWFKHFALGVLPRDRALRFLDVHNRHHLKIVAEILSAGEEAAPGPQDREAG